MPQGFITQLPWRLLKESDGGLVPAVGWKITTYETNSTTPKETFSDGQLASENTNPIITDSDGSFRIFIAQGDTNKCVVTDENDVSQFPYTFDYQQPMIPDPSEGAVTAIPVGGIVMYHSETPPTGFLYCDGSAVSRVTYSDLNTLYSAASYPFGNGNGTTTFNVPDFRGFFPFGAATSGTGSTIGTSFGAIDHTHTGPSHTHTTEVDRDGWGSTTTNPNIEGRILTGLGAGGSNDQAANDQTFTSSAGGTGNTGTGNPPGLPITFMVKY